jgi:hypothetical protein
VKYARLSPTLQNARLPVSRGKVLYTTLRLYVTVKSQGYYKIIHACTQLRTSLQLPHGTPHSPSVYPPTHSQIWYTPASSGITCVNYTYSKGHTTVFIRNGCEHSNISSLHTFFPFKQLQQSQASSTAWPSNQKHSTSKARPP